MAEEISVLQKIREKELELSIKIDEMRREADQIILEAKEGASKMIENSEREGKRTSDEYYKKEMERISIEIEQLRKRSDEEAKVVRERGERNLPPAVEKIVRAVTLE
jgi:vacuolar-type H+-ATPase subunit H